MSLNTQIPDQIDEPDQPSEEFVPNLKALLKAQEASYGLPPQSCKLRRLILSTRSVDDLRCELQYEYWRYGLDMIDGMLRAIEALETPAFDCKSPHFIETPSAIEFLIIRLDASMAGVKEACAVQRKAETEAHKLSEYHMTPLS
jgi:hypothetical protein